MSNITAYTDGSAVLKYPYLGGFGSYIKTETKNLKIRKGFFNTKTGRMELTAVIYVLRSIKNKQMKLVIYSDSMYVVNTCNEWIDNWERVGFIGKKNVDLLKQLAYELRLFNRRPELRHVKGHQEHDEANSNTENEHIRCNNIADELADYKTQKSYEQDVPFGDLAAFEVDDFYEVDGKVYYDPDAFIEQKFNTYRQQRIDELKKDTHL
jgi:ribonuclease HI